MTYLEVMMSGTPLDGDKITASAIGYLESQRSTLEPVLSETFNDVWTEAFKGADLETEEGLRLAIVHLIVGTAYSMVTNKESIADFIINMLNQEYDPDEIPDTPKLVRVK